MEMFRVYLNNKMKTDESSVRKEKYEAQSKEMKCENGKRIDRQWT